MKWYYKYGFTKPQIKGLILILVFILISISYSVYQTFFYSVETEITFLPFPSVNKDVATDVFQNIKVFDPNTVDKAFLVSIGLDSKIASRVVNYCNSGGRFKQKEDLLKIYDLDTAWFASVIPYIYIEAKIEYNQNNRPDIIDKRNNAVLNHLRPFDLNEISSSSLQELGLGEKIASTIINYRNLIGGYKEKEELLKVYGMSPSLFNELSPYIRIRTDGTSIKNKPINLNEADSLQLMKLPGIGPTFALRIIKYRERLGGYVKKEQLLEVYGMDSVRYNGIIDDLIVDTTKIKQVYINSYSFKEILRHPYINYEQVRSIVEFREKVAILRDIDDLLQLEGFSEKDREKLLLYISFN